MDLTQLRTFVAVAREGSITRASEAVHLSQPAVSAHVKTLEETLGLALFERTPRGMRLTPGGQRLLARAEETLAAHQALLAEASRSRQELAGRLSLGAGSTASHQVVGRLLSGLAERHPGVEVALRHRSSHEVLAGLRSGSLDAGIYHELDQPGPDLATVEVGRFEVVLVAAPGLVATSSQEPDWKALSALPWVFPTGSACCGGAAERLFASRRFRPGRIISADRQELTLTLVSSGLGVGLLHGDAAEEARRRGAVEVLWELETRVRVLFACLQRRAAEPALAAAAAIMREPARP